jgi:hypothetical protein
VNVIDTCNLTRDQVFALRGYGASETAGIAGLGYKNQTRYMIALRKISGIQEEFEPSCRRNSTRRPCWPR